MDYQIRYGKAFGLAPLADNIKKISGLNIRCAPRLIWTKTIGEYGDMILITQMDSSEIVEVRDYRKMRQEIQTEAKASFLNDFDILIQ